MSTDKLKPLAFPEIKLPSYKEIREEIYGKEPTPEALLAEVDELLRTRPAVADIQSTSDEVLGWIGRFKTVIEAWDQTKAIWVMLDAHLGKSAYREQVYRDILSLLHQARGSLRLRINAAAATVVVDTGKPFDYFDALRKMIETATAELFFVDRFLDAEFAGRYLPLVPKGVKIRLLGDRFVSKLAPAVEMFVAQSGAAVEIRSADVHDRYLFVDGRKCFTSGASFKDGGKYSPTLVLEVTDAFDAVSKTYETMWAQAKVIR